MESRVNEFWRYVSYGLIALAVAVGSAVLGIAVVVGYQIFYGDDSQLKKSTILARINEETTIYMLDEQSRIGSFFEEGHRSYINIDEIPPHVIRAMVAAEDKNYYKHFGIDPIAIFTAFYEGVASGFKFHRGGSTLTQQTVKNILDRRDRTFTRKFKEMIRALQLERMYSKAQILEFYFNQFHVTSNGKGIGIAAQHYFNKKVEDLTLVEGAFIAGSVKAPNKYNPFTKYTKEAREKAWSEADGRKNYVLRRMYEQGWINQEDLKSGLAESVPFNRGKFSTEEVALVSLIRSQLNRKEILEALDLEDIAEIDSAGLKVYTTLDSKMQVNAQLMMRRNLSRLETILEGFSPEPADRFKSLRSIEVNQFYYGKVDKIEYKGGKPQIILSFGIHHGIIPYESLERTAKLLDLSTYKGFPVLLKEMMEKVKIGDILFVEVMEIDPKTHESVLEMRKYPTVNGGIIAVDKGEVRAIVSGFEPKGYNRAIFATRQPGSVFKSVVYYAALQLGWTVLDQLDNERQLFPFQGKFYYPRPDHSSPYTDTSMLWSGTKSENLASIYLAANLLDKLNFGQYKELMRKMNLMPLPGESAPDFHYRVARDTGVQLDNDGVKEHLLKNALRDLKPDLIFAGKIKLMQKLDKMWWGRGYLAELNSLMAGSKDGTKSIDSETLLRIDLVKNNVKRMGLLADELTADWQMISGKVGLSGAEKTLSDPILRTVIERFRVVANSGGKPDLAYVRELPEERSPAENATTTSGGTVASEMVPGRPLNALDVQAIWSSAEGFAGGAEIFVEDVLLGGYLPLRYFNKIQFALENRYSTVTAQDDKYALYQYFNHHDFRIVLGLKYLVKMSQEMGVYSALEPVLSFPLGTNVVSVAEVAKIYQTFTDGKIYRFYKEGPNNQLNFIRRIEDRNGNILFETKREEYQLIDPCVNSQIREILSKVITHGTGRRARSELQIDLNPPTDATAKGGPKIRIPAFGKTGTTNDYTTAYFAGFLPYPITPKAPMEPGSSYVIASYVGYDMNKTMRRGPYLVSGAYGALPVWTDFAKTVIEDPKYVEYLDTLDINTIARRTWPIKNSSCTTSVYVDLPTGALASGQGDFEVFESTNYERDGEVFVNEFEKDATVSTLANIPIMNKGGFRESQRMFTPFNDSKGAELQPVDGSVREGALDESADGGGSVTHISSKPEQFETAPAGGSSAMPSPATPVGPVVIPMMPSASSSLPPVVESSPPKGDPPAVKSSNANKSDLDRPVEKELSVEPRKQKPMGGVKQPTPSGGPSIDEDLW